MVGVKTIRITHISQTLEANQYTNQTPIKMSSR